MGEVVSHIRAAAAGGLSVLHNCLRRGNYHLHRRPRDRNSLIFSDLLRFGLLGTYLNALTDARSRSMTDFPYEPQPYVPRLSVGGWALALSTAFIVLIITGVLPRLLG
jgi:hypothetical protein